MALQYSTTLRTNRAASIETTVGTAPKLQLRTGAPPANCAASDTGTLLAEITLPSDWAAQASGQLTLSGTWTGTASGTGTAGHFRVKDSGGTTTHIQGGAGMNVAIATSAATAANGNVLTFAATTGVAVGQTVTGTGVPTGTTVAAVTGTTVTLSQTSTAGVASGATVTFGSDMVMDNSSIASGQTVNVTQFTITQGNA